MRQLLILILSVAITPVMAGNLPWEGDCCNASGICMRVSANKSQLVLLSDGRGGSVGKTVNGPAKQSAGGYRYTDMQFTPPSRTKDGLLRLNDDRQFMCFKE